MEMRSILRFILINLIYRIKYKCIYSSKKKNLYSIKERLPFLISVNQDSTILYVFQGNKLIFQLLLSVHLHAPGNFRACFQ